MSVALPDATSTEAPIGEPVDPGLQEARSFGVVAGDWGGVCGGGKSTCGDTGLCIELVRYVVRRQVVFTLEPVIRPAEPLAADAPEATAEVGDGARTREVEHCLAGFLFWQLGRNHASWFHQTWRER